MIYINGKDVTDKIAQYSYRGDKCVVVFKNSGAEYSYGRNKVRILKTAVSSEKAFSVFNYLKEIVDTVGLETKEGDNILSKSYQSITHISEDCILANFLNGTLPSNNNRTNVDFFPFGFNLSQKDAVNKAFSNNLSVIEGPPGTGKTQIFYCKEIFMICKAAIMSCLTISACGCSNENF